MNAAWNAIPLAQRQQFLNQAGLSALPEPSALDASQWNALAGIAGETAAEELRQTAGGDSVAEPLLEPPEDIGDWSSIMAMVAEIRTKISELQQKTSVEDIKARKDKMAEANKQEAEKIKESLAKLEKAASKGKVAKVLGWIGAIAGVIGAVVATVATGGAAAPLLAVAVIGLTMMILQETGAMEKIVDYLAENPAMLMAALTMALGPAGMALGAAVTGLIEGGVLDEDQAKMAIQITLGVAMLMACVAGIAASGGASATQFGAQLVGLITQIVGGLTSAVGGGFGVAQAVHSYQAAEVQADVQENKAWLAKLQQMLSEEMDRLQQILEQLSGGVKDASDALADIASSNRTVISSIGM